jgi:6-phospho-beta-glucosidase
MNLKSYRFSISWSRIMPEGTGEANQEGIDWYLALIAELKANDITPLITLYHWDLPLALEKGHRGWLGREVGPCTTSTHHHIATSPHHPVTTSQP